MSRLAFVFIFIVALFAEDNTSANLEVAIPNVEATPNVESPITETAVVEVVEETGPAAEVEKKLREISEVRKLDVGILEEIRDPFYYNRSSLQSASANTPNARFVAIVGNKVKLRTGEWLGKDGKVGQQFIIKSVGKDQVILEDEFGNEVIQKLQEDNNNVKISFK